MTSDNIRDIHVAADIPNRIATLQREGIRQLTDPAAIKAMKPAEIEQARRDGRLLAYMSGIKPPASED